MRNTKQAEEWRMETQDWMIVEYPKKPNKLRCSLASKKDDFCVAFPKLGVKREILENAEEDILNGLIWHFHKYAVRWTINVSEDTFWDNLAWSVPLEDPDYYFEDVVPESEQWVRKARRFIEENDK